jgi:hypothetical protein
MLNGGFYGAVEKVTAWVKLFWLANRNLAPATSTLYYVEGLWWVQWMNGSDYFRSISLKINNNFQINKIKVSFIYKLNLIN